MNVIRQAVFSRSSPRRPYLVEQETAVYTIANVMISASMARTTLLIVIHVAAFFRITIPSCQVYCASDALDHHLDVINLMLHPGTVTVEPSPTVHTRGLLQ